MLTTMTIEPKNWNLHFSPTGAWLIWYLHLMVDFFLHWWQRQRKKNLLKMMMTHVYKRSVHYVRSMGLFSLNVVSFDTEYGSYKMIGQHETIRLEHSTTSTLMWWTRLYIIAFYLQTNVDYILHAVRSESIDDNDNCGIYVGPNLMMIGDDRDPTTQRPMATTTIDDCDDVGGVDACVRMNVKCAA